jgi:hypothetical protein
MVEAGKVAASPRRLGKDAMAPSCAAAREDVRGEGEMAAWKHGEGKRRGADHDGTVEVEMASWRRGARGGAEVAGDGCGAHLDRRRARSSPVGRRRPPVRQIPADTGGGVAGRASSDLAGDGVNGWGGAACGGVVVSGNRCWWRAAAGGDDEWIGRVRAVVEMNG